MDELETGYKDDPTIDEDYGIRKRFTSELRRNFFSLEESSERYIDVANSFAPSSPRFQHVIVLRVGLLVWTIIGLARSILDTDEEDRFIWLGYLTHLGLVISIVYQITACIVTLHKKSLIQHAGSTYNPSGLVKVVWFLYVLAVPNELIITLLYWTLDYPTIEDGVVTYNAVFTHGILAVLLLIDGNLIARIPVRIKHIVVIEIYSISYLIWTVIHAFSGIGNGSEDGDLLYDVIDWKDKPIATLITCVIIVVVVIPIIFMVLWFLSLAGGRRPLYKHN